MTDFEPKTGESRIDFQNRKVKEDAPKELPKKKKDVKSK